MKCILIMFDSLNRRMLSPYGCDWTHTPNFKRLAEKSLRFDNAYVCSLPCMPARRELHTGRPNFLHRAWSPLEPFDDSMPEILKNHGIYTHMVTDHFHYFEDGGCTYHSRYSTWELFRGQEGDQWAAFVKKPPQPETVARRDHKYTDQYYSNLQLIKSEDDMPQSKTFSAGIEFIRRNHNQDKWFLQIETFDPHEPFFSDGKYKDLYAKHYDNYKGRPFDWPPYRVVQETPEEIEHARTEYAALLSMCDAHLGRVLKLMDELDLWKDTMLIVCTDHGYLLGEHDCWAKSWTPYYNENANVPLFIWDPRTGKKRGGGEARKALVQTIDFAPTILEFFGIPPTKDMLGKVLRETLANDTPVREAGIFGNHGGQVHVTDGRYVYMRAPVRPDNQPLFDYTMMPTRMDDRFHPTELANNIELAPPFTFTKNCHLMKIRSQGIKGNEHPDRFKHLLFDLSTDPAQLHPISDPAIEKKMIDHISHLMKECDAPSEQWDRLGISKTELQS
ncbi:MAG: sulfatase [Phycisphaerales bacterium]|nr:sulfatase [Phycisphaerales bacterium]